MKGGELSGALEQLCFGRLANVTHSTGQARVAEGTTGRRRQPQTTYIKVKHNSTGVILYRHEFLHGFQFSAIGLSSYLLCEWLCGCSIPHHLLGKVTGVWRALSAPIRYWLLVLLHSK
jgi:hypothetical protein